MVGSRAVTVDALGKACRVGIAGSAVREFEPDKEPPDLQMYVLMKGVRATLAAFG